MDNDISDLPAVAGLILHFTRSKHSRVVLDINSEHENSQILSTVTPKNEIVCLLDIEDSTVLKRIADNYNEEQTLLWSEKTNVRQLGLYTLLIWCQAAGLFGLAYCMLSQICGWIGECYTYLSPGVYWIAMLVLLGSIARFADTQHFKGKILGVENGIAFWMQSKSLSTSVFITNGLQSKVYSQGVAPCPITVLYCRWKQMQDPQNSSSFIKIAFFIVPKDDGIQVPVTCDVIDTLRASFRSSGLSFMNYHGLLIADIGQICEEAQRNLMTFLFRSGFSILCHDTQARLMIAMKRMGGYGVWKLEWTKETKEPMNTMHDMNLILSIGLHFLPCKHNSSHHHEP